MSNPLTDIFTERDGETYCGFRIIAYAAAIIMGYKFVISTGIPDYTSFAYGIGAIGLSVAGKNLSEKPSATEVKDAAQ
jgi:hypothetical protein